MLRTWSVRLSASVLTLSVRSFQTPETPAHLGLAAEPALGADLPGDARDLVGEGRELVDHRVDGVLQLEHLAARVDGDLLGEVAVRDRGRDLGDVAHLAGEVVGERLTLSVRSFQVPRDALDLGLAAELALGADLARDARDLVGEERELVDHRVDRVLELGDLALDLDGDLLARSPCATAVVTCAMSRTWVVRLPAMKLTLSVRSFHVPETPSTRAWPPSWPSVPTSRATRVTSSANERSWSTIVLMVSFSSSTSPRTSTVIFCDRSPRATAVVTWAMLRTWRGQVARRAVDVVGQVLPDAGDALDLGLAAELALGADLAGDAGDLGRERAELVDHHVDRLLQLAGSRRGRRR